MLGPGSQNAGLIGQRGPSSQWEEVFLSMGRTLPPPTQLGSESRFLALGPEAEATPV